MGRRLTVPLAERRDHLLRYRYDEHQCGWALRAQEWHALFRRRGAL